MSSIRVSTIAVDEEFISLSANLDRSGLVWYPEIGDEISERIDLRRVSILVDPRGLTPKELRESFIWLPTVEQLVFQFEAREALIYHAGITKTLDYEAVVKTPNGVIETHAPSLRLAFGKALHELLTHSMSEPIH